MELSMTKRPFLAALALVATLALPSLASAAQLAYAASGATNLRAGPSTEYPVVARVLGGSAVNVYGCVAGHSWCDVGVQGVRGWMIASRLEFVYGGRRVLVPQYYAYFGAPVVTFDLGYWDRWYRGRPWYVERGRWFPGHWGHGPRRGGQWDSSHGRGNDRSVHSGRRGDPGGWNGPRHRDRGVSSGDKRGHKAGRGGHCRTAACAQE
jgi:uncharacterized protein YraI